MGNLSGRLTFLIERHLLFIKTLVLSWSSCLDMEYKLHREYFEQVKVPHRVSLLFIIIKTLVIVDHRTYHECRNTRKVLQGCITNLLWWIQLIEDCCEAELICRKKNAEMVEIDSTQGKGLLEELKQSDESDSMIRGVVLTWSCIVLLWSKVYC